MTEINYHRLLSDIREFSLKSSRIDPGYGDIDKSLLHTPNCDGDIFSDSLGRISNVETGDILGVSHKCIYREFMSRHNDKNFVFYEFYSE